MVSQAFPACLDKRATLASLVNLGKMAFLVFLDQKANVDSTACPDQKEILDCLAYLDIKEILDSLANPVYLDNKAHLACQASLVSKETLVNLDMEPQACLEKKASRVYPENLDEVDYLGQKVLMDHLDSLA